MVRLLLFQILYSLAAAAEYGNPPRAATDSGASTTAVPLLLLPAPTQLLVELMAKPPLPHILVVDTPRPRFSFVPRDDVALQRNMTHFRARWCGTQSGGQLSPRPRTFPAASHCPRPRVSRGQRNGGTASCHPPWPAGLSRLACFAMPIGTGLSGWATGTRSSG